MSDAVSEAVPELSAEPVSEPTRVCGVLGAGDPARVRAMAEFLGLGTDAAVHQSLHLRLVGAGIVRRPAAEGQAWMFSTATPSPHRWATAPVPWQQAARDADVAGVVLSPEGRLTLHASISGVQPLYVQIVDGAVWFSTHLEALVRTASTALRPDASAWAAILGAGAPMAGRTTVEGVRRLAPMESVTVDVGGDAGIGDDAGIGALGDSAEATGGQPQVRIRREQAGWEWEDVLPEPGLSLEQVRRRGFTEETIGALRAQVAAITDAPWQPMLSGGRDSRMLAGLAAQLAAESGAAGRLSAWSTSSDIGHTLEELTGARIARLLGVEQRIVTGRQDGFAADFLDYARATGFQASFHVWLMPVARQLAAQPGTVLDGLGGGIFLGGGFADEAALLARRPTGAQLVEDRFARACKYLGAVHQLLRPEAAEVVTARAREDFMQTAERYAEHPQGATLTAYLTRTLPGISMAPAAVLGSVRPTAVPIMSHEVVSRALSVPHEARRDGAWYPDLMAAVHPQFREIPTAADLTGVRQHKRRGATIETARWYRGVVMDSPAAQLVGSRLVEGSAGDWQRQLEVTGGQHVIRGLALLALWWGEHHSRVADADLSELWNG